MGKMRAQSGSENFQMAGALCPDFRGAACGGGGEHILTDHLVAISLKVACLFPLDCCAEKWEMANAANKVEARTAAR